MSRLHQAWSRLLRQQWLGQAGVLVVLLAVWEAWVRIRGIQPLLVPTPSLVAREMARLLTHGELVRYVLETLKMLAKALGISLLVAFGLTTLASMSRFGRDLLTSLTGMLSPLPAIALLPLALLWFGIGQMSTLFVLVNSMVWALALNAHTGFQTVPTTLRWVGRNLGLSGWSMVTDIYLPAALPHVFTGLKLSWSFGWRTAIAAELVYGTTGAKGGLGWMLFMERYSLNTPGVFSALVTIIILGLLVELGFQQVERHTIRRWGLSQGS